MLPRNIIRMYITVPLAVLSLVISLTVVVPLEPPKKLAQATTDVLSSSTMGESILSCTTAVENTRGEWQITKNAQRMYILPLTCILSRNDDQETQHTQCKEAVGQHIS